MNSNTMAKKSDNKKTSEFDECVKKVKKKMEKGEVDESYVDEEGEKQSTDPYSMCEDKSEKELKE